MFAIRFAGAASIARIRNEATRAAIDPSSSPIHRVREIGRYFGASNAEAAGRKAENAEFVQYRNPLLLNVLLKKNAPASAVRL